MHITDTQEIVKTAIATCPSCGARARFIQIGEQSWPERVAKAVGMPTTVQLWNCAACHTTLLHPSLRFEK